MIFSALVMFSAFLPISFSAMQALAMEMRSSTPWNSSWISWYGEASVTLPCTLT